MLSVGLQTPNAGHQEEICGEDHCCRADSNVRLQRSFSIWSFAIRFVFKLWQSNTKFFYGKKVCPSEPPETPGEGACSGGHYMLQSIYSHARSMMLFLAFLTSVLPALDQVRVRCGQQSLKHHQPQCVSCKR